jgi:amino acid adenylation domain-containing protein
MKPGKQKKEKGNMKKNSLQHRLEENFTAFKNNIALARGTQTMTYCDLDKKSGYIADWLINKGMKKGAFIGILMNDRVQFIYTMIGILKAGCVFVSLDPAYPKNRLELMINSTNTQLVLMDEVNYRRFISSSGTETVKEPGRELVCIDDSFLVKETRGSGGRAAVPYNWEDPVYIYFTSGTTGTPKGILGKNRSLLHFINWEIKTFNIDETHRISQLTTPGFDAFLRDVFVPLFSGGCICIPPDPDILFKPGQLVEWIEQAGIHLIHCVPSLFRQLNTPTASLSSNRFKELKYILLSGESIHPRDLTWWYGTFAQRIQLVNLWGPTETTLIKSFYFISQADVEKERIPIGKPMAGAQVIILDEAINICKEGMTGKLYLRTPYRTLGYCNDPELTAERFIKNPFNNDPTDLLYDTGDLGRLLADGNIEFLGREDRQVKVMGVRIELAAIENVLLKHPAVNEAVVVKHVKSPSISTTTIETAAGDEESLCAYIISKPARETETAPGGGLDEVRAFLSNQLPAAMIPPVLMEIEKIPRKPNGKVDYEALPAPQPDKKKEYAAPVNEIQQELAELWSDILKIERISINSHFFELGGNSLNLMTLVTKIHKVFDVRLSLDQVFNNLTIENQAAIIADTVKNKYFSIEPVEKKEYYILSPAQQRIYFLHHVDQNSTVYNLPQVVSLAGELDRGRVEETFVKIIKKHESFRTTFDMIYGTPVQIIHDNREIKFILSYNTNEGPGLASGINDFFRPFDLGRAPLLRVGLINIGELQHILVLDTHHIISDGVSLMLLIKEIMQGYAGEEAPGFHIHYKDFSEWQNRENQWLKKQEAYWLSEFSARAPVLNLPADFSRPARQDFDGYAFTFQVDKEQTVKLKTLCSNSEKTLFMVLMAVFTVFLSKITGQEDIVVGTGVEGRRHEDTRHMLGMFVNTLAARNYPHKDYSFHDFLETVGQRTLKIFENRDYPLELLVEKLKIKRDASRNPLFDVVFMLQNIEQPHIEIPGVKLSPYEGKIRRTAKFDMTLQLIEVSESILGEIEYSTALFRLDTIKRLINYFKKTMADIVENPGKKLSQIEIISREEKQQVLYDFNDTAAEFPRNKTIHELFAEQAAGTPDHTALWGDQQTHEKNHHMSYKSHMSYKELNEKAGQLAYRLQEKGVQADRIVGIMVDRSIEMVIGMLAILKAGGAYLPIDPDYPQERIQYMLKDSSAGVLLTTPELRAKVKTEIEEESGQPQGLPLQAINIEKDTLYFPGNTPLTSTCQVNPANLAYIIYTSGTTGRPKGMMIEHRNLVRLMFNDVFLFDFNSTDVWTLFHSCCFDFSVWEMYGALLYGGRLVIIPKMAAKIPEMYLEILKREGVTILNQTPSAFYNLIAEELKDPEKKLKIKYVIFGGEALKPGNLNQWNVKYPDTKLINMFGITETTVHVTFKELNKSDLEAGISNIGKPLPTLTTYITDSSQKLVPVGMYGECLVGGEGVGRGYLNRPRLTREKFIPDVYRKESRLYKSGDLIRFLENGELEYRGRIDHQVKIRGFRVEPGEIEARLIEYGEIKQAVVLSKDSHLYAYIETEKKLNASHLRDYLAGKLPPYMIPSHFIEVEKIPLTGNGKVDTRALELMGRRLELGQAYVAPQNEIERKIVNTWKEVLQQDDVGIHDNYFDLGGTSLDILRINGKLKEIFRIDIPMVSMFTYPTVHSFAVYLEGIKQDKVPEIRDRTDILARSKLDRRQQLQRRKGGTE